MGHGGKRPGSGKPKGVKWASTLEKNAAREMTRQYVTERLQPILRAQIAHAQGIGHLFTRDKNGKFSRVEDEAQMDQLLAEGTEGQHYWIFTKDPSVQAATELLNRALDKPSESVEMNVTGSLDIVSKLQAARARLKK